jgi:hypothetical protein
LCRRMDRDKKRRVFWKICIFSILNYQKKLFCQTVFQNSFRFTIESAPPAQPQPELPQPEPQLYQMHPKFLGYV